jgi:hypothetical protein
MLHLQNHEHLGIKEARYGKLWCEMTDRPSGRGVGLYKSASRWLDGLYLDQPDESDDPYRFFRW